MRWLFLFVLVLNFAYVAWELNRPEKVLDAPRADRHAPKIVLLSEIGQDSMAVPIKKSGPEVALAGVESVETEVAEAEPVEAKQAEPEQVEVKSVEAESIVEKPLAIKRECFTLGPFRDLMKLRAMTRGIKNYVADASYRSNEEQEQEMFWVYLKPSEDYSKAKELTLQLKKKKVKDYFIVGSGEKVNGISLGHFREKDRAYTHAERIKSLGFRPDVEPIFKTYTIYWLDYELASGKIIPEKIFDKHLTGKINRLLRDCS